MCNPYVPTLPTYPTTTRPPPSPPTPPSPPSLPSCQLWKQFRSSVSDPAATQTKAQLQVNCGGRMADKCNLCPKAWCSQDCSLLQTETASGCVDKGVNTAKTRAKAVSNALRIMEAITCPAAGPGGQAIPINWLKCSVCILACGLDCWDKWNATSTTSNPNLIATSVLPAAVLGGNADSCRLWRQFKQSFQNPFEGTSKQVNCGDHSATWCGACPGQSGGAASCGGDCGWVENDEGSACVDNGENFQIERKMTASALEILEAAACPATQPGVGWWLPLFSCILCTAGCALECLFP